MKTTPFNEITQLESLYLLIAVKELGGEYRIKKEMLDNYLGIKYDEADVLKEKPQLNILSIIILLYYYGNSVQYKKSKETIIEIVFDRFRKVDKDKIYQYAELSILALDMLACPYISKDDKENILILMDIDIADRSIILKYMRKQKFWFTRWTGVNLNKELNAKISQEVYS